MSDQVFEASEIPRSLWDPVHVHGRTDLPKGQLRLPARLEQAYLEALHETGLIQLACDLSARETGEIGEQGEEGARQHFATRFSGSCARIQLFALDPHQTFKTTRQAMALLFSAGKLRLLDIPLGAGAGAIALLSLVAELRSDGNRVLPRFDLDVQVVGGDHNKHQIDLAKLVFQKLRPWWLEQGINVTLETMEWDILNDEQTEDLVHLWEKGLSEPIVPAIVGANFSGFLGQSTIPSGQRRWIDEAESCLRHIFSVAARRKAVTFWIEPTDNRAVHHFMPKLRSQVFERFTRIKPTLEITPTSSTSTKDPVIEGGSFATRASGIHLRPTA